MIGAHPSGQVGPVLSHPEQRAFPRISDAAFDAALGVRPRLQLTGGSFATRDGTAVRDYIHVHDLVRAHLLVLSRLEPSEPLIYNVGLGRGYTVKEFIAAVEKVAGRAVPFEIAPARPGDPAALFTDPAKIRAELGWRPRFEDLEEALATAWRWRVANYPPVGGVPAAAAGTAREIRNK